MRAIVLGNKDLAVRSLDDLARQHVQVCGVILNPEDDGVEAGRWYKSLAKAAGQRGIPAIRPRTVNSAEARRFIRQHRPDLLLSLSYARIIKEDILAMASSVALNIHFSKLPDYRGCLPLVYAMASGETSVGVTLHEMDAGIDTGDIIAQASVPVSDSTTAKQLYFDCVDAAQQLLQQTLPSLIDGSFSRQAQDLQAGSYHPQQYPGDRWLQPEMTDREFSCFVRAHTFPPYPSARARIDGEQHEVTYCDGWFEVPRLGIGAADAGDVIQQLHQRNWERAWLNSSLATK